MNRQCYIPHQNHKDFLNYYSVHSVLYNFRNLRHSGIGVVDILHLVDYNLYYCHRTVPTQCLLIRLGYLYLVWLVLVHRAVSPVFLYHNQDLHMVGSQLHQVCIVHFRHGILERSYIWPSYIPDYFHCIHDSQYKHHQVH